MIDFFTELLQETNRDNLLVRACKLYIECEYIICALTCLSYFRYKIGMPFLNMVENSSQKDWKYILPQLYKELQKKNVECLSDYRVEWIHLKVYIPV